MLRGTMRYQASLLNVLSHSLSGVSMFIIDGIAYAGQPEGEMKVISAKSVGDFELLVRFSTGETRLFDGSALHAYEAFAPLFENKVFDTPEIQDGILTWLGGEIDISTAKVYAMSYQYDSVA